MESSLFRKSALDRISSPEQLNEYMKVAGPGVWIMLCGLMVVFAAFFIWGVTGSIPETANISGTALAPHERSMAVYCYLPISETKLLLEGMEVRVSPDYAPKEQYGYIYGKIKSISHSPVTADRIQAELGEHMKFLFVPSGNVIEVVIELETQDGGLKWSSAKGASVDLIDGSSCALTVITAERKPYELMFR